MKKQNHPDGGDAAAVLDGDELLSALVAGSSVPPAADRSVGVVAGELVAMADDARTPLVIFPGQTGTAAVAARSIVDLHGAHIGRRVLLVCEGADPMRPIVLGLFREGERGALEERPGSVAVDADGQRMVVTAREQLVLRCGKASITLTKAGKVLINGTYVSNRATGVTRIKGGSVQIN